jgi:hydrogenase maturation protease
MNGGAIETSPEELRLDKGSPVVVIGYGNEVRGDDGVGPRVARVVAGWQLPHVKALAVHQLLPELVESFAEASAVVFVDASLGSGARSLRTVMLQPERDVPRGRPREPSGAGDSPRLFRVFT